MSRPPARATFALCECLAGCGAGLVEAVLAERGCVRGAGRRDADLIWSCGLGLCDRHGVSPPDSGLLNHFSGLSCLTDKAALADTAAAVKRRALRRRLADHPLRTPETYVLPRDAAGLRSAITGDPGAVWICKPADGTCGQGIFLTREPLLRALPRRAVVQRYLSTPHLLAGAKYSLRCYVLVTSFSPVRAWLYGDGFAKLCTRPFSLTAEAIADPLAHLTNPEIQQHSPGVPTSDRNLTHREYRRLLRDFGLDDEGLWNRIRDLVAATVIAARDPVLAASPPDDPGQHRRFELLGFDVLVDEQLQPWLCECNLSPSLTVEAAPQAATAVEEERIKRQLVDEMLDLVGVGAGRGVERRFEVVVPAAERRRSARWFDLMTAADAAAHGSAYSLPRPRMRPSSGRLLAPPEELVWQSLREGLSLEAIRDRLQQQAGGSRTIRSAEVNLLLSRWLEEGLVTAAMEAPT